MLAAYLFELAGLDEEGSAGHGKAADVVSVYTCIHIYTINIKHFSSVSCA